MKTLSAIFLSIIASFGLLYTPVILSAEESTLEVMITPDAGSLEVEHNGKTIIVQRNQDREHRIRDKLTLTSRECPPHCVQPISILGVETIGEIELLERLRRRTQGDRSVLIVDTRPEKFVAQGTIPGSINVHGDLLIEERGANMFTIEEAYLQFGVKGEGNDWDYSNAKELVLFCFGIWCGQAPKTINALVELGYPKEKLKWYRGGIQAWESLGLTTIRAENKPQ